MKKGLSLIEVLAALALGAILLTMQLNAVAYGVKVFKLNGEAVKESMYLNEAFSFIEQRIKEASTVSVSGNELTIYSLDTVSGREINKTRIIKKSLDKLTILYYEDGIYRGENTIVKNIAEFQVVRKGNLLFVNMVSAKGEVSRRCFGVSIKE